MTKTESLLSCYLDSLGITGHTIKAAQDTLGYLITVIIPKDNKKKIGILKGKRGKNLMLLKQLLRVVGILEGINPFLVIKLE